MSGCERVAVLGMACRLPGAVRSPSAFWELLSSARSAISVPPATRWDLQQYYLPQLRASGEAALRAGFLDRIDTFDANFFQIDPHEAAALDPQQRLLLELTWEALLSCELSPQQLRGTSAGVYIAVGNSDYDRLVCKQPELITPYSGVGTQYCTMPGRISYALDLRGPSFALDTGCSSALVALHLACASLRAGEIDLALVGATNLIIAPEKTIALQKAGMLSPTGMNRTFDHRADGYMRGEGCAMLVLQRESTAAASGRPVLGYICGSAVNHDGTSNGFLAPRGPAQQAVITRALQAAALEPERVTYLETHGTATRLGDMIEVHAAAQAYRRAASVPRCVLGALKANIGHLEPAAGLASIIKVLLCGMHGAIPPASFELEINPQLKLDRGPFVVTRTMTPWPSTCSGRGPLAGVSAFSFCGTNAHVIIEGQDSVDTQRLERARPSFDRKTHWFDRQPETRELQLASASGSS